MKVHPIYLIKFLSDLKDVVPEMACFALDQIHSFEKVFWMGRWSQMKVSPIDLVKLLSDLKGPVPEMESFAFHQIHSCETVF